MSLIFQKIQIMAQPKKLLLELCPSGDPTPETLRAATQIWSAGQGFHFTQWLLFWGSKTCLSNHLGFHGSLLAPASGREMGATKLCNKHILEFTNLLWTLRGECLAVCSSTHCFKMGLRYKPWMLPIPEVSQAVLWPSRSQLHIHYMNNAEVLWISPFWVGMSKKTITNLCWCKPVSGRLSTCSEFPSSATGVWEVCFGDLWPFFLPTRLILSFFAMYVNLGKIIA